MFSLIANYINYKLNKIEHKLISLKNDIKYNQYLINTRDNNSYPDTNKDIRVVIYGNDKKVMSIGEINMYQCKELLDRLNTTPIRIKIQDRIITMYYKQGILTNV